MNRNIQRLLWSNNQTYRDIRLEWNRGSGNCPTSSYESVNFVSLELRLEMGVMLSFSIASGKVLWSLIYPQRIALFSGGLSTKIPPTPDSSTGLFTPAVLKGGESGSELWGEVRGELVSGVW